MRRSLPTFALAALLAAGPARAEDNAIGTTVERFTLPDTAGKAWSLPPAGDDAKAVVVVFLGTACPINNAFLPTLVHLHDEYGPKGVRFVAVNSLRQDSAERVAEHAGKHHLPFPVLKDASQVVADRFGARRTPEAFLLDAGRVIRYRGRIDDQFGFDYRRPKPTHRELAEAIDAVLAGTPVATPVTAVEGCIIERSAKPKAEATVTYAKEVSRIVQAHCQECHRPGQIGPMPLLTHDDASSWAGMIREVVASKRMPPWHADPRFGHFRNERGLSDADRNTLLAWVDQGCPAGDPKDLPPAQQYVEGWAIGKPDAVFTMPQEFKVPAQTPARGVRYQYFMVDTNFDEDRWVQAAEAKPGARSVVHHIIVYAMEKGQRRRMTEDQVGEGFLTAYAPGDMPSVYAPGEAKRLPKGARLVFQMHYTPDGIERVDRSSVGLVFAKEPPRYEVKTRGIQNPQWLLSIPAGADNHEVTAWTRFPHDTLLVSLLPHMHLRGKDFQYEAVYPDGRRETLLSVPRYDFNWQSNYRLREPLKLPAGTKIECTAHFDNSPGNKSNPDPTRTVKWGDQTWEEMMIGFVDYVVLPGPK
jgi:peroxiredoxin